MNYREVLRAKILKFCVVGAEILAKNKAENAFFFSLKIENGKGAHERRINGKLGKKMVKNGIPLSNGSASRISISIQLK